MPALTVVSARQLFHLSPSEHTLLLRSQARGLLPPRRQKHPELLRRLARRHLLQPGSRPQDNWQITRAGAGLLKVLATVARDGM